MTATEVGSGSQPAVSEVENSSGNNNLSQNIIEDDSSEWTCHLKWIPWNSGKIPIVMQSRNGPCPLIATINVLLLREKLKLPTMLEQITATQLLTYLGECIMDSVPANLQNDENAILNLEQNIHDAIEILPKLKTGLDVNIRFTGITDFEYTPECIIFDLLRIPLYHGWLISPDLTELKRAIGSQSYNQLVDNIITNKTSNEPEAIAKVLLAEEFLEQTASQLTLHGLNELKNKIKDNEIGILFRNNHFLTLFKRESQLYTLVTDQGYLTEDNILWESLDNIEGAGRFFDANFFDSEVTNRQVSEFKSIDERQQQLANDFLVALSLHKEENNQNQMKESEIIAQETKDFTVQDDFELAKYLQSQEDGLAYDSTSDEKKLDNQTLVDPTKQLPSTTHCNINQSKPVPYSSIYSANDQTDTTGSSTSRVKDVQLDVRVPCESTTGNINVPKESTKELSHNPCDTIQTASQHQPTSSKVSDPAALLTPKTISAVQPVSATAATTTAPTNFVPERSTSSLHQTPATGSSTSRRQRCEKNVKETNCIIH